MALNIIMGTVLALVSVAVTVAMPVSVVVMMVAVVGQGSRRRSNADGKRSSDGQCDEGFLEHGGSPHESVKRVWRQRSQFTSAAASQWTKLTV